MITLETLDAAVRRLATDQEKLMTAVEIQARTIERGIDLLERLHDRVTALERARAAERVAELSMTSRRTGA